MKSLWVLFLVLSMLLGICSCSSGNHVDRQDDEDDKTDHWWGIGDEAFEPTEKTQSAKPTETSSTSIPGETVKPRETVEQIDEPVNREVSLPEQLIFDQDNITVKVTGMSWDNELGPQIFVFIENNGVTDVMFVAQWSSVNGAMVDLMLSGKMIAAGKKANDVMMIYARDLKLAGIEEIKDIEFQLAVMDDQFSTISRSPIITLKTVGSEDYTQVFEPMGDVVLEQDGIKVSLGIPVEIPDYDGINLPIFLENTSGKNVTVQLIDTSVNGNMFGSIFHALVLDGKVAYKNIFMFRYYLDEYNIDMIEKLEFKVVAFDPENPGDYILESEPIVVTFE